MVKTPQTLSELLLTYSSKMFVTSLKRRLLLVPCTHFTLKVFFFGIWEVSCVFFNICFPFVYSFRCQAPCYFVCKRCFINVLELLVEVCQKLVMIEKMFSFHSKLGLNRQKRW